MKHNIPYIFQMDPIWNQYSFTPCCSISKYQARCIGTLYRQAAMLLLGGTEAWIDSGASQSCVEGREVEAGYVARLCAVGEMDHGTVRMAKLQSNGQHNEE